MIPFEEAVRAMDAASTGEHQPKALRISTDTRAIQSGDTFLALRGERFDGHAFLEEAIQKGATTLIIDETALANAFRVRHPEITILTVKDTLRAYMACAALARESFTGLVIGVTGSTGKTTTKEFLAQLLAAHFGDRIAASPANENNEIGVSKFLLANAGEARDVLVVEFGARHYGDVAELVAVAKPNIGILTNIGEAHIEIMGSRERLAETKWGIFSGGARAILNAHDEESVRRAPELAEVPYWFDGETIKGKFDVRVPGLHNHANLAAAIAGAREAGVPLDTIVHSIPHVHLPPGRYEEILIPGAPRIIYDAYNANASGVVAALETFAQEPGARRIVVLSSMAELGDEASALHERVGAYVARTKPSVFLAGGAFAEAMISGAKNEGFPVERIVPFTTNEEAADWLRDRARPEDVVLLKGSRVYKLEEIIEQLRHA